jgi:hypothetical protein
MSQAYSLTYATKPYFYNNQNTAQLEYTMGLGSGIAITHLMFFHSTTDGWSNNNL